MSSTNTASDELRDILTEYCHHPGGNISDKEIVENSLTQVSEALRYALLSSITNNNGDTVLTLAAYRGHTELCVTLLSSLPPADRLKLILVNKRTALHSAAYWGRTETVSGILNCLTADQQLQLIFTQVMYMYDYTALLLQDSHGGTALHYAALRGHTETVKTLLDNLTPEQQLQLLFTQDSDGNTALHYAARWGHTETVKTLLDNLTPEQQLKLLSVKNKRGNTASQEAVGNYRTDTALEQYKTEADYKVFRKFASLINNF